MYMVQKVGTVLTKRIAKVPYFDPIDDKWTYKKMKEVYGEICMVEYKKMRYTILWDGGDMEHVHFWELPTRKDIRVPSTAEIILYRKRVVDKPTKL